MARQWQGSKWIRQSKRLAIYLRDGLACAYCGAKLENGAQLTLDHCRPVSRGKVDNGNGNLITCCKSCNSSRQDRPLKSFITAVAAYRMVDAKSIEKYIRNQRRKSLKPYCAEAKSMLTRRNGTFSEILKSL